MPRTFTGGCQCGAIRYVVEGDEVTTFVCHCTECQRQSASAFGMALWIRQSGVERLGAETRTWVRTTSSGRRMVCEFCPTCGTRLFHYTQGQTEIISIKPGSLDDTSWLTPRMHIWTRSAQPWVVIPGDCAAYPGNPPELGRPVGTER